MSNEKMLNTNEQALFQKLMEHTSPYYGYELSNGEIKVILQAFEQLKRYKEIGSVEQFAEAMSAFERDENDLY